MEQAPATAVSQPQKRRRFNLRFGLLGLFLAVMLSAVVFHWINGQVDNVRERHAALEAFRAHGGIAESDDSLFPYWLPWYRRLLGDERVDLDFHIDSHDPLLPTLQRLFPESFFYLTDANGLPAGTVVPEWYQQNSHWGLGAFFVALILLFAICLGVPILLLGCVLNYSTS